MEQPESKTMPENITKEKTPLKASKPVRIIIVVIAIATAVIWGGGRLYHSFLYVETDNAQIEGDVYPVISRIPGKVQDVLVDDNRIVKKGETLIRLEAADYEVRRDIASAALQTARASVLAAEANANAAAATERKLNADLGRNNNLRRQDVVSQAEFDAVRAGADAAKAQYASATSQRGAAVAQVKMREAELRNAELQLSYTTITAPASGHISRKSVQPGQYVAPGQQLIAIVGSNKLWIVANFKETQLQKITPGLPVIIHVDAYPDREFKGKIESISSGTGAKFSLLPPDNASGNFIKVAQRVPVKIVFTETTDKAQQLAAGMNVVVEVKVK
ncbi:HlyD family secretion protein [Chlorobium sp. BLA1]|uniref:HlyD family secretion protein n=1 Tax=Candidatus Chlorobium masyuteum TaxID=2716876 RepID=UPI00141EF8E9|nr:HlyD family secretion protein [Candidatus Chlorobium masyuteum]NHQ59587.1 HlyD family secretion protein [Candidatus Chlorobium masyuteum]